MGKQLISFITCGYDSSPPFFVIYKAGACIVKHIPSYILYINDYRYILYINDYRYILYINDYRYILYINDYRYILYINDYRYILYINDYRYILYINDYRYILYIINNSKLYINLIPNGLFYIDRSENRYFDFHVVMSATISA